MKKLLLLLLLSFTIAPCARLVAAPKKRVVATVKWPTFRQSASKKSSPDVTAIQYLLRSRGVYKSRPDGIFGAQAAAAVRAFQRKSSLSRWSCRGANLCQIDCAAQARFQRRCGASNANASEKQTIAA